MANRLVDHPGSVRPSDGRERGKEMRRWTVLATVLGLIAAGCSSGGGGGEDATRQDDSSGGEGWTILAYSIADTDLEPFMVQDVNEMGEVGSGEGLNIVALVDRAEGYSTDPLLDVGDYTGAKLLQVNQGSADVIEDVGDLNTGDPEVLADFITRGIEENPAAHYALVISDHGASWPGVGGDESAEQDSLDLQEIRSAISTGLEGAGVEKLDLLGFDACLMATYEVASTLAPLADRMLASQELEPGHGWDYRALQVIADDPSISPDGLGAALIDGFEGQAEEEGTDASITLSLIDLTQMPAVDEALADFGVALSERADSIGPVIGRTRAQTLGFGRSPDPSQDTHMADLGMLAGEIGVEALDVSDQADVLIGAINDAVVDKVEGQATKGATGLSIYFPPEAAFFSQDYLAVETPGAWNAFLASYYDAGESIPVEEQPAFTSDAAEVFFDEDGLNIFGTFDLAAADNLAEATISYGIVEEDGSVTFIGDEPGEIAEDGSGIALGIYDLTVLTLSDGEDTTYAYLSLTTDEEEGITTIDVPMAYYSPEDVGGKTYQDVLLTLTLDAETGDIINETYYTYDGELGTYGELTAEPEGIIVPEVLTIDAEGTETWVPTSDVGLFADLPNLQYDLQPLDLGTQLYVELSVSDFGGNSDSVSAQVAVP